MKLDSKPRVRVIAGALSLAALALLGLHCSAPSESDHAAPEAPHASANASASADAWATIYGVLQHPRCMNCHPAGDIPLQGDDSHLHAQNVQRGADGKGRFALRCDACHQTQNLAGAHLPPGAPNWHLPKADMPLVFQGKSSAELCLQLKDPKRNGGKTPEQLFEHMAHDPLVLWGWKPGDGREPVSTPHAELVRAMRAWVDGGCDCP